MKIEFEITLQDDKELIFQNDGTAPRIVVKKFELWVQYYLSTVKGKNL